MKVTKLIGLLALLIATFGLATPAHAQLTGYGSEGDKFLIAVRKFDAPKAMGMLREPGNNLVDYRGREGEAAMHIAVRGRKMNWVDALAGFDADVDIRDKDGDTPLMIAIRMKQADIASRLLGYGASVNLANRRGETPLILAVQARHENLVEVLLRDGADPDATDSVAGLSARDYARRDTRNPRLLELIETTTKQDDFQFGPVLR